MKNHCPNIIGIAVANIDINNYSFVHLLYKYGYAKAPEKVKANPKIKLIWKVLHFAHFVITIPIAHNPIAAIKRILKIVTSIVSFVI
jgi:hypothetical protein